MNKRKLGRTHLHVSELCLDTTKFGLERDDASSLALLDAYHTSGGSFVQSRGFCPNSASAQLVGSSSEEVVGRWQETRGIRRDNLVLASRINFFRPVHGGAIAFANLIRQSCEHSLRRLRTHHLDLLICDWDDQLVPVEDLLESVDMLVRAGLVRYAVAGGFPPWRVVDSIHRSGARNHARFEAIQTDYSLMTRAQVEPEAFSMCRELRLGFLANCGNSPGNAALPVLTEIADKQGAKPAQIALAWVLRHSQVTSAVISPTAVDDLRELIRGAGLVLSAEETGALANATASSARIALQPA